MKGGGSKARDVKAIEGREGREGRGKSAKKGKINEGQKGREGKGRAKGKMKGRAIGKEMNEGQVSHIKVGQGGVFINVIKLREQ